MVEHTAADLKLKNSKNTSATFCIILKYVL